MSARAAVLNLVKQVLPGIPGDPHLKRDAARLQDQGRQRVAVAVHDLSRPGRLIDLHQLIARGDDGHDGPLVHAHVGAAQGGKHADLGGAQNAPLRNDEFARLHVLARLPDVEAGSGGNEDLYPAALRLGVFHADNGIGPLGQGGARHDPDGLAFPDGLRGHPACGDVLQDVENGGFSFVCKGRVGSDDGIAVHGRVGQGRDGAAGDDVLADDAAEGRGDGDVLATEGMDCLENGLQGFIYGYHGHSWRVFIVGAGLRTYRNHGGMSTILQHRGRGIRRFLPLNSGVA